MRIIITTTWNSLRIVEAFLDHHRALGFDLVMVMDFGSTDGTLDLLRSASYAGFVEIVPFPGIAGLDSSNIMLSMAKAKYDGSSLCLFCDLTSSSCWVSGGRSQPRHGGCFGAHVEPLQRHRAPFEGNGQPRQHTPVRLPQHQDRDRRNPAEFEKESGQLTRLILHLHMPKVLVKLGHTIAIAGGVHNVELVEHASPPIELDAAYLLHYPFSTFDALKRKLDLSRLDFAANPTLPPTYGWHVRRWIRFDDAGSSPAGI